jgi:hypothetical protein
LLAAPVVLFGSHYHLQVYIHLQTARLAIRRFTADEDNLVRLNSDPEIMRYIAGRPPGREEIRDEIIPFHLAGGSWRNAG